MVNTVLVRGMFSRLIRIFVRTSRGGSTAICLAVNTVPGILYRCCANLDHDFYASRGGSRGVTLCHSRGIGACPVTTDFILTMTQCDNNNNDYRNI